MSKSSIAQFIKHLESIGYDIEPAKDKDIFFAKHKIRGDLLVREYRNGILIQRFLKPNKYAKLNRMAFLEMLNQFNASSYITTCSSKKDGSLIMSSAYVGKYDKKTFGDFLDAWKFDSEDRVFQNKDFKRFIESS